MPEPQLFIDELRQFADRRAFVRWRLEIERTADMQGFHIRQPGEGDVVIGELARDQDRNLIRLGPVKGPLVDGGQSLDDVDGMLATLASAGVGVDEGHQGLSSDRGQSTGRVDLSVAQPTTTLLIRSRS